MRPALAHTDLVQAGVCRPARDDVTTLTSDPSARAVGLRRGRRQRALERIYVHIALAACGPRTGGPRASGCSCTEGQARAGGPECVSAAAVSAVDAVSARSADRRAR